MVRVDRSPPVGRAVHLLRQLEVQVLRLQQHPQRQGTFFTWKLLLVLIWSHGQPGRRLLASSGDDKNDRGLLVALCHRRVHRLLWQLSGLSHFPQNIAAHSKCRRCPQRLVPLVGHSKELAHRRGGQN